MYHYIRDEDDELPYFRYLHTQDFDNQLKWMSDNGGFVKHKEFIDFIQEGRVIPSGFLLTFDDGLKDHIQYVLPLLKKYKTWGIFFGCSKPATEDDGIIAAHIVHFLLGLWGATRFAEKLQSLMGQPLASLIPQQAYAWQKSGWHERAVKHILNYSLGISERDLMLTKLLEISDIDPVDLTRKWYLNDNDYRELADSGMMIAAHSHSHPVLSALNKAQSLKELSLSISYFDQFKDPVEPRGFCYPYGLPGTFNETQISQLKALKVTYSFAVMEGDTTLESNRFQLPRYDCNIFPHGQSTVGKRLQSV